MKRIHALAVIFGCVFSMAALAQTDTLVQDTLPYEVGRMMVKLKTPVDVVEEKYTGLASLDSLTDRFGVVRIQKLFPYYYVDAKKDKLYHDLDMGNFYAINFQDSIDVFSVMSEYLKDSNVQLAYPSYKVYPDIVPCDPMVDSQWSLVNTGQYGRTSASILMDSAWLFETGDTSVVLAILDSGLDTLHYDFQLTTFVDDRSYPYRHMNQIWRNPVDSTINGIDEDGNGYVDDVMGWDFNGWWGETGEYIPPDKWPFDHTGHGTWVSGVAAAEGDSVECYYSGGCIDCSPGITGVTQKVKLMVVKVGPEKYGCTVKGCKWSYLIDGASAIQGIYYATNKGADIINYSASGANEDTAQRTAIEYAYGAGVIIVASSGNISPFAPQGFRYPQMYDEVFSVGATDTNDTRWVSSNWNDSLDVVAPGVNIITTSLDTFLLRTKYERKTGTSLSAPAVSGLAALILSRLKERWPVRVDIDNAKIYDIIRHSADDQVGDPGEDLSGKDPYMGWGRVNGWHAMIAISRGDPTGDNRISLADIVYLVNYILHGGPPPLHHLLTGDANCNQAVDLADVNFLVNYIFHAGPPPSVYWDCSQ